MKKVITGISLAAVICFAAVSLPGGEARANGNQQQTVVKYRYNNAGSRKLRENEPVTLRSAVNATDTTQQAFEDIQLAPEVKITIYPNPTRGILRVDISGKEIPAGAKIYISNVSGAYADQLTGISTANTIDISAQPPGLYIMRIELDKEHVSVWKVIKE